MKQPNNRKKLIFTTKPQQTLQHKSSPLNTLTYFHTIYFVSELDCNNFFYNINKCFFLVQPFILFYNFFKILFICFPIYFYFYYCMTR